MMNHTSPTPTGFLIKAIENNWANPKKVENSGKIKRTRAKIFPSQEDNKIWYKSISYAEKLELFSLALSRSPSLKWQLEDARVSAFDESFVESSWFLTLMQLIGRAEEK